MTNANDNNDERLLNPFPLKTVADACELSAQIDKIVEGAPVEEVYSALALLISYQARDKTDDEVGDIIIRISDTVWTIRNVLEIAGTSMAEIDKSTGH